MWFSLSRILKAKPCAIFVVVTAFFLFQLFLLLNSFSALYRIYAMIEANQNFWTLLWLFSEVTGEIGLILRFGGACMFVAFAWVLLKKREFSFSVFRKAVLLEGIHYLFYIPFIVNLFTSPAGSDAVLTVFYETAISYTIQTVLVFSSFIMLYTKIKPPNIESSQLRTWTAIAAVSYVFALWVKHFLFSLYALPIDFTNPVLIVGLVNSILTMLVAALTLLITLAPVIRGQTTSFSQRAVGLAFILIGAYFIIYILVAQLNSGYMAFLPLIELWAISFAVTGTGLVIERST